MVILFIRFNVLNDSSSDVAGVATGYLPFSLYFGLSLVSLCKVDMELAEEAATAEGQKAFPDPRELYGSYLLYRLLAGLSSIYSILGLLR